MEIHSLKRATVILNHSTFYCTGKKDLETVNEKISQKFKLTKNRENACLWDRGRMCEPWEVQRRREKRKKNKKKKIWSDVKCERHHDDENNGTKTLKYCNQLKMWTMQKARKTMWAMPTVVGNNNER